MSEDGGVRSVDDVNRLVSLMKDMNKLESRCTYLNAILCTEPRPDILHQFVQLGGWKIMNEWLAQTFDFIDQLGNNDKNTKIVKSDFSILIEDVLKALKILPVDLEILKQNATPRLVKDLSKDTSLSEEVQSLAGQVVQKWTDVIKREKAFIDKKLKNEEKPESKNSPQKIPEKSEFSESTKIEAKPMVSDKDSMTSKKTSTGSKVKLTGLDLWGPDSNVRDQKSVGKKKKRKHDTGSPKEVVKSKDSEVSSKSAPSTSELSSTEGASVPKKKKSEKDSKEISEKDAKEKVSSGHPKPTNVANHAASASSITSFSPPKPKVETSCMDILGQIQAGMDKTKNSDISLKANTDVSDRDKTKDASMKSDKTSVSSVSPSQKTGSSDTSKPATAPKPKPQIRHLSLVDDMFKDVMTAPVVKKKKKLSSALGIKAKNVSTVNSSFASDINKATVKTPVVASKSKSLDDDKNTKTSEGEAEAKEKLENSTVPNSGDSGNSIGVTKIGKPNKKGRSIKWKEDKDLVLVKIYELDDEERAMKSVFSSAAETESSDSGFFAKRELLLERKIRMQNNGSYSGGDSQAYGFDTCSNVKWVLFELTLSDDMKVNRGHLSTEKTTQTLREQSVPAEVYPNLLTVPLSPKEPNYDASGMSAEKKPPIIIPYDDIEPQGMDIDNDSEPEQDEDEKIFHELFPNAAKKEKSTPVDSVSPIAQTAGVVKDKNQIVSPQTSTAILSTSTAAAFATSKTTPVAPPLSSTTPSSSCSSLIQTASSSTNSTNSFNLKIAISARSGLVNGPVSTSGSAANTCRPNELGSLQSVPFTNASSISPTGPTSLSLQPPINGLISPGAPIQPSQNGLLPLNFNLQTQVSNNASFPFAASSQMGISPNSVGISPTGALPFAGLALSNNLNPLYSNNCNYNTASKISPPGGTNMVSPVFPFPQGQVAQKSVNPNTLGTFPSNRVADPRSFGYNQSGKITCRYYVEGKCNHPSNHGRFLHDSGSGNAPKGTGSDFKYQNGNRNYHHNSNNKHQSNHYNRQTNHQQHRSDDHFSKHKHSNNNYQGSSVKPDERSDSRHQNFSPRDSSWKSSQNSNKQSSDSKSGDKR